MGIQNDSLGQNLEPRAGCVMLGNRLWPPFRIGNLAYSSIVFFLDLFYFFLEAIAIALHQTIVGF